MKKMMYSVKGWKWFACTALFMAVVPLLVIANYNHSMSDDWVYGVKIHEVILLKGFHPIMALKALYGWIRQYWYGWQGTYSAILLFQLQPAIWGEEYYRFGAYILSFCVIFSTMYFFRSLFSNVLSAQKQIADIVSIVVLVVWFELMPAPVQGLYWWNGASYYVIFCALMLWLCGLLFNIQKKGSCSWIQFIGLVFGVFFIAGGNFVTALLMAEILFLNCVFAFWQKNKCRWQSIVWFVVQLAGFLFSALAPGNAYRQVEYEQFSAGKAIIYSFSEAYFFMEEHMSVYVILALLFLVPFLWRIVSEKGIVSKIPYGVYVTLAYCFFASSFTPNLYAYGEAGPGRIQNIRYWMMLVLYVILLVIAIAKMKQCMVAMTGKNGLPLKEEDVVSKRELLFFTGVLAVCFVFTISHWQEGHKDRLSTLSAIHSMRNGEAKAYDAEWDERIEQLLHSSEQNLVFERIKNKPHLIYFQDIFSDKDEWRNQVCAQYYKKESVRTKKKNKGL